MTDGHGPKVPLGLFSMSSLQGAKSRGGFLLERFPLLTWRFLDSMSSLPFLQASNITICCVLGGFQFTCTPREAVKKLFVFFRNNS